MKVLLILRGLPGSGKSAFVQMLIATMHNTPTVCCADDYMVNDNGEYDFNPKRLPEVHGKCQNKASMAMFAGHELVVIANTSTTEWAMKPYLETAKNHGYMVHSLIVENRHGSESIHNVPDKSLSEMKTRFEIKL